ncbi:GPI anchored CFEM domain protein [Drechslerella dactyloides]|uniref:GPI anchored CFEM domain protein n=1 Tax=Drechslerella dactyloides TaxID=74499 RepID=A0AAD6J3D0_DREDA|nr:GPI anchored CFEM domain protein [Drechslerella dactyloides]
MKTATVLAVAASLSAASATLMPRQIAGIPQCALTCALSSLGSTGCTDASDFGCICKASSFIESLIPCVKGACSPADFQGTVEGAQKLCSGAGVTLDVSSLAGGATSAASSAATSGASSAASSAASNTAAPTSSGASSAAGTPRPASSAASSSAPSNASGRNNTSITGTRAVPSSTTTTTPNAAGRNAVAFGGLAAVLGFAVVLL